MNNSVLAAMVVAELLVSGAFERIAGTASARLADRRRALLSALDPSLLPHREPTGGFFVWMRVPNGVTSTEFVTAARSAGVKVADGRPFFADTPSGEFVRASFSMLPEPDLRAGGAILTDLARRLTP